MISVAELNEQQPNKKYLKYQYEKEIATYGNQQMAIKILMNSLYGATSNE